MKPKLFLAKILSAGIACLCASASPQLMAQVSFSPPPVVASNNATWVPQPTTNVIIGYINIPQHVVRVQNQNFGATNALAIPFFQSLDGTNKIFYSTSWTIPTNYIPSGTNITDTIIFPATNVPVYASAAILTTNDANTNLQVGIFLVQ